jgi:hypothetical protein
MEVTTLNPDVYPPPPHLRSTEPRLPATGATAFVASPSTSTSPPRVRRCRHASPFVCSMLMPLLRPPCAGHRHHSLLSVAPKTAGRLRAHSCSSPGGPASCAPPAALHQRAAPLPVHLPTRALPMSSSLSRSPECVKFVQSS